MTKFNILGVDAATPNYDPVPRGRYRVVIANATYGDSQAGNPKINIDYEIVGGEFEGKHLFDNLTLTEAALPFLRAKLEGIMGEAAFKKWAKNGLDKEMLQRLADSGKLNGIELLASVRIKKNRDTGDGFNTVDSVTAYEEAEAEEEEAFA